MKIGIIFILLARTCIGDPIPPSQKCPEGWLQNLGHCFLFGSDGLGSWAEAKEYCKEKGGFLAEIPNEQTNTYLFDNMKTTSDLQKKWWWIGANDIANEGQFTWDNSGASVEFDAWNNNNPDDWQEVGGEDCAALYCKNKNKCFWNDLPCSGNYQIFKKWNLPAGGEGYPLCEKPACDAATTCSGQGTCTNEGSCACNEGFSGTDCSIQGDKTLISGPSDFGAPCPIATYEYTESGVDYCCCHSDCCWSRCTVEAMFHPNLVYSLECLYGVSGGEWRYSEELGYFQAFAEGRMNPEE